MNSNSQPSLHHTEVNQTFRSGLQSYSNLATYSTQRRKRSLTKSLKEILTETKKRMEENKKREIWNQKSMKNLR